MSQIQKLQGQEERHREMRWIVDGKEKKNSKFNYTVWLTIHAPRSTLGTHYHDPIVPVLAEGRRTDQRYMQLMLHA